MPVVQIDYEGKEFSDSAMQELCTALRVMVSEVVNLEPSETVVYARKYQITAGTSPIEIYVNAGAGVITDDATKLRITDTLIEKLKAYKAEHDLTMPFSLSIIKMDWKCSFDI